MLNDMGCTPNRRSTFDYPVEKPKFLNGSATYQDYVNACNYISTLNRRFYPECLETFANEHDVDPVTKSSGIDVLSLIQASDSPVYT